VNTTWKPPPASPAGKPYGRTQRVYGRTRPSVTREYLTLGEAAILLGCDESTLRRKVANGEVEALRLGVAGAYRFRRADLEAMLTAWRPQGADGGAD
jgi:excisionase family DNA binding protein